MFFSSCRSLQYHPVPIFQYTWVLVLSLSIVLFILMTQLTVRCYSHFLITCGITSIVWSYLSFWACPKTVLHFTIILTSLNATELGGNIHNRTPPSLYMVSLAMVSVTQSQQWSDCCGKFQNQTTHMFQITFIMLFCYNCSFLLFIIIVNFFLCLIHKLNFMRGMYV
jgi:hypothetical protein